MLMPFPHKKYYPNIEFTLKIDLIKSGVLLTQIC